jgi:signal peptidase I
VPGVNLRLPKPETRLGGLVELVVIVVLAIFMAFAIQAWAVKPYQIPSGSMEPTLDIGQRILVNRLSGPEVGDVVVFHPPLPAEEKGGGLGPSGQCGVEFSPREPCPEASPERGDTYFVKRVVAGPGDTIAVRGGRVILNGKLQDEPFIYPCAVGASACTLPKPIKIPPGRWFMMGDNRGASDDSRFWGPISEDWMIGDAFATYWPPSRVGSL